MLNTCLYISNYGRFSVYLSRCCYWKAVSRDCHFFIQSELTMFFDTSGNNCSNTADLSVLLLTKTSWYSDKQLQIMKKREKQLTPVNQLVIVFVVKQKGLSWSFWAMKYAKFRFSHVFIGLSLKKFTVYYSICLTTFLYYWLQQVSAPGDLTSLVLVVWAL